MADFNIEELIHRVDVFRQEAEARNKDSVLSQEVGAQKSAQEERRKLSQLKAENIALHKQLECARRLITDVHFLLGEARTVVTLLEQTVQTLQRRFMEAETRRLRFYGIIIEQATFCVHGEL